MMANTFINSDAEHARVPTGAAETQSQVARIALALQVGGGERLGPDEMQRLLDDTLVEIRIAAGTEKTRELLHPVFVSPVRERQELVKQLRATAASLKGSLAARPARLPDLVIRARTNSLFDPEPDDLVLEDDVEVPDYTEFSGRQEIPCVTAALLRVADAYESESEFIDTWFADPETGGEGQGRHVYIHPLAGLISTWCEALGVATSDLTVTDELLAFLEVCAVSPSTDGPPAMEVAEPDLRAAAETALARIKQRDNRLPPGAR